MKKFILAVCSVLLSAIMCVTVFSGCGRKGMGDGGDVEGEVDTSRSIVLVVESAAPLKQNYKALLKSEEEDSQLYKQAAFTKVVIEGFKALYPNITVRLQEDGWGDALWQQQQLYIRSYQDGKAPDVDVLIGESYMNYLASNGVFAALDSSKFTHILSSTYTDMVVNEKMYGAPLTSGLMGLQYNTEILKEAGIPEEDYEPSTWAELLENCKKVSEYAVANGKNYGGIVMNNVRGLSSAYRAIPFMRAAGGDFRDADGNFDLDSAENVKAYSYLRELAQYAYSNSLTETSEDTVQYMFNQGRGAYFVEGQWSMASAEEHIKSCNLPSSNEGGTGNVMVSAIKFGVATWSDEKAAAQAFLQYITGLDVQKAIYEYDGRLPVHEEYLKSDDIRTVYPNINGYIDAMLASSKLDGIVGLTKNTTAIWEKWGNFYSNILTGKDDIAASAKTANDEINQLLAS